jgi:hypothetical protein
VSRHPPRPLQTWAAQEPPVCKLMGVIFTVTTIAAAAAGSCSHLDAGHSGAVVQVWHVNEPTRATSYFSAVQQSTGLMYCCSPPAVVVFKQQDCGHGGTLGMNTRPLLGMYDDATLNEADILQHALYQRIVAGRTHVMGAAAGDLRLDPRCAGCRRLETAGATSGLWHMLCTVRCMRNDRHWRMYL